MKRASFFASAVTLPLLTLLTWAAPARSGPPATRKAPVTDTYFGTTVVDNYRWLENVQDPEVTTWLKAQADYSDKTTGAIPGRDSLVNDFMRIDAMRPATISSATRKNGRYFYKKTLPSENVGRLFYRDGLEGKETLLFDPAAEAPGAGNSLAFFNPSEDGKRVVLGVAAKGSETATVRFMDVDTRKLFPESLGPCWARMGGWTRDGSGFLYHRLNGTDVHDQGRELNTACYFHVVGTDQKQDLVVLSAAKYPALAMKPEDVPVVQFSDDFKHIFGVARTVRKEQTVFYAPASELRAATIHWKPLLKPADAVTGMVVHGETLYLLSHKDAPRYRVLATSLLHPDVAHATEVLPQSDQVIKSMTRTKDYLLVVTTDGVNDKLLRYAYARPKWEEFALPARGSIIGGGYDATTNDGEVVITSWVKPPERYQLDAAKAALTLSPLNVAASFRGIADIVVEEVEAPAADGTPVPLTIMYNKRVARDGSASCYLSGYGAYGMSRTPEFNLLRLGLLNRGVVTAIAHVRGGGEKGYDWYHAGYKATKPNTWNDFIACAQYLEDHKYTSAAHLFGEGTSAGGILIGRSITERPDLFAAAICNVPCANALRMENSPNGPNNTPEFGTVKDSAECRALMEMDAFQHVKDGVRYPAVICVGGFNDPRVIVWQAAKMAAALQNATASGKPVLLQVNYDSGHFTEDKKVTFRNFANMYAFCLWQTGHPEFQPAGAASN